MMGDRWAYLDVSDELFLEVLKTRVGWGVACNLPRDTKANGFQILDNGIIRVLVESRRFPELLPGDNIPVFDCICKRVELPKITFRGYRQQGLIEEE